MAVPRHDATRLDVELAQAEKITAGTDRLLAEIRGRTHHVGHAFGRGRHGLRALAVRHHLVGGAFAGEGRRRADGQCTGDCCRQRDFLPFHLLLLAIDVHDVLLLLFSWVRRFGRGDDE